MLLLNAMWHRAGPYYCTASFIPSWLFVGLYIVFWRLFLFLSFLVLRCSQMFFSSFNDDIRGWDVECSDQLDYPHPKGAALHISGSIASLEPFSVPPLHWAHRAQLAWWATRVGRPRTNRGRCKSQASGWKSSRSSLQLFSVSQRFSDIFSVFSDLNFTCYNKLQVTTISF